MITLVLGGTRSGKSAVAEALITRLTEPIGRVDPAAEPAPVTYIATAAVDPSDADHLDRVRRHRARRPAAWTTVETGTATAPSLAAVLRSLTGPVLVDSLGTWISGQHDFVVDIDDVVDALGARDGHTVVVSEEVGLALHAPSALGRAFVDRLGEANQAISAVADRAVLVVAGRVLELPPPAGR